MGSKARAVPLRDEMYLQTNRSLQRGRIQLGTTYTIYSRTKGGSGLTYPLSYPS